MKNLILLNMSHKFEWDSGVANRNYHIFRKLQQQYDFERIICVDFLPFTFKKRVKVWLKGKLYSKNANTIFYNGVSRIDSDETDPSVFWMTALNIDSLPAALEKIGVEEEESVLWSYNPFTSRTIKHFKGLTVFDAVDNWIDHPAYVNFAEELKKHYSRIQKHANIIFTVSEGLVDFFDKKKNVFYIPNGVDAAHFAPPKKRTIPESLKRTKPSRPLIGYHGVIQERVNFTIVKHLVEQNPNWDFALVGPVWDGVQDSMKELSQFDNVYTTGAVSYKDLPQYIHQFDVAMIPHKVDRFTQSMNPLKMYEYLAAGKAVVASPVAGSAQFEDYISTVVSGDDFAESIASALQNDSQELKDKRIQAAMAHSWESRAAVMLDKVQSAFTQLKEELEQENKEIDSVE